MICEIYQKKINSNQMEFIYFDYDFQTVNLTCQKLSQMMKFFLQGILYDIVSICVLHIRNIKCFLHCHQLNPMSNFLSSMHLCISRMEWLSIDLKCSAFFVSLVFVFVIQFSHFWIENDIYFRKWVKFSSWKMFCFGQFSHLLQKLK